MKLINTMIAVGLTFAANVFAQDVTITSQNQSLSTDKKSQTYSGNVRIALLSHVTARSTSTSVSVSLNEAQTVLKGNVEIDLDYAIAKTNRAVMTKIEDRTVIEMDSVTLFYK